MLSILSGLLIDEFEGSKAYININIIAYMTRSRFISSTIWFVLICCIVKEPETELSIIVIKRSQKILSAERSYV